MLVSSLIHERTLKTVLIYKKTILRETMYIEKGRARSSQLSYTYGMNMKLLEVVTPPSIYQ